MQAILNSWSTGRYFAEIIDAPVFGNRKTADNGTMVRAYCQNPAIPNCFPQIINIFLWS
jgi:hypothetical protein